MAWYVDDVKISHMESSVVDEVISNIEEHFGKMTMNKEKKFDYLGMNVSFEKDKKIKIEMKEQILEAIEAFGEELNGTVTSPTPKHIFRLMTQARDSIRKGGILFTALQQNYSTLKKSTPRH